MAIPERPRGGLEAHVRHGGGDDGGLVELSGGVEVACGEQQHGVSVDDATVLVGEEGAIGVAVEGDAERGLVLDDLGGDYIGVQGSATLVDVAAGG